MSHRRVIMVAVAAWLGWGPAAAQPAAGQGLEPGAPALAAQRYAVAKGLYVAGNIERAAEEFQTALDLFPTSVKLTYNLARCQERLGRLEEAAASYRRYLELAPQASDSADVERLVGSLQARADRSRPRLTVTTQPPGAEVFLDSAPAAIGRTPLETRVAPGTHALRVVLPGYKSVVQTAEAVAGRPTALALPLQPDDTIAGNAPPPSPAPASRPATSSPTPPDEERLSAAPPPVGAPAWRRPLGWGLAGLGVVLAGAGTYFLVAALDAQDATRGVAPVDADERDARADDLETHQTLMWVSFLTGVAAGGAGAYLLLAPSEAPTSARAPSPLFSWGGTW